VFRTRSVSGGLGPLGQLIKFYLSSLPNARLANEGVLLLAEFILGEFALEGRRWDAA
jgi:hypothetical protein